MVDDRRAEARLQRLEETIERLDLGAQIVAELSAPAPTDYAGIFKILADKGHLSADLAGRMGDAARQRNLLVHLYMEVDDSAVFDSLTYLDDLRQFAAFAQQRIGG